MDKLTRRSFLKTAGVATGAAAVAASPALAAATAAAEEPPRWSIRGGAARTS